MSDREAEQQLFAAYLREAGLAATTIKFYLRDIQAFSRWYRQRPGAAADPAAFTAPDVEAYKRYLKSQRGHSPATINRKLQSLRKFGQFAAAQGADVNNARDVRLAPLPEPVRPATLSPAQQTRLLEQARARRTRYAWRDYLIVRLLLGLGLRAGELARLRAEHLDAPAGELYIASAGDEPDRRLPLPAGLAAELRRYAATNDIPAEAYLFQGRAGQPMSVRMVQQVVDNLGQCCGLPLNVRLLRDSYASKLWQQSGDLDLLARRLGYKQLTSALRHIR